jgi:predicted TIM-barrel fold metal-dependent hydrolase
LVAIAEHVSNDLVSRVARDNPNRFVPVGSINPAASDTTEQVARSVSELAQLGFAGLKLHPRLNRYDPLDDRCLAAIRAAEKHGLVVFVDTLFRQPNRVTRHPVDIVDKIANHCPQAKCVLLHGGGPCLLEMSQLVCLHANLILDLSFTLLRYQGSSLDQDIGYLCEHLDRRLIVGSDFPEYLPSQALERILQLTAALPAEKRENILFRNLQTLFL